jgi:hypothetical protein
MRISDVFHAQVQEEYPYLARYEEGWAVRDFFARSLRNHNSRAKLLAKSSDADDLRAGVEVSNGWLHFCSFLTFFQVDDADGADLGDLEEHTMECDDDELSDEQSSQVSHCISFKCSF